MSFAGADLIMEIGLDGVPLQMLGGLSARQRLFLQQPIRCILLPPWRQLGGQMEKILVLSTVDNVTEAAAYTVEDDVITKSGVGSSDHRASILERSRKLTVSTVSSMGLIGRSLTPMTPWSLMHKLSLGIGLQRLNNSRATADASMIGCSLPAREKSALVYQRPSWSWLATDPHVHSSLGSNTQMDWDPRSHPSCNGQCEFGFNLDDRSFQFARFNERDDVETTPTKAPGD